MSFFDEVMSLRASGKSKKNMATRSLDSEASIFFPVDTYLKLEGHHSLVGKKATENNGEPWA
jgi:hypothetical protein